MFIKKITAAIAGIGLLAATSAVAASSTPAPSGAARLSVAGSVARTGQSSSRGSRLGGEASPLIGLAIVAAIIVAVYFVADSSDDPDSA